MAAVEQAAAEQAGALPGITARAAGPRRVIAASCLLAPGHFAGLVRAAGADLVSIPLADHPAVIQVAARCREAGAQMASVQQPAGRPRNFSGILPKGHGEVTALAQPAVLPSLTHLP